MTQTAVVILNYNGEELLRKFLPSVLKFSENARIIVADNNSSDKSVEVLTKEFPQVEVIRISSNLGFCGGYNYALSKIEAKYFVLLNSDVEVTENWIEPVVTLFENKPTVGAAQPKILSYSNRQLFEYAGAGGGFIDTLGYPFCRGRIFNSLEIDKHQYDDTLQIFWATGACLFVRAELFRKMEGFDEDFFAHMEEIDFCWKLNRAGYSVLYQGASTVYHLGGGTLSVSNPRKTYLNFRNGLSLIVKHLSTGHLLWKLPIRIFLDWVAIIKYMFQGSVSDGAA
ncbi:MAG: glycosyltransferase family 2 protein, partial [Bacteroidia bacterium]|nr:glycosyltransferase family 2 protein [Bacteroidia bacterium]